MPSKAKPESQAAHQPTVKVTHTQISSSPFPAPEILYNYNQVQQGLSDRIIALTEKQAEHRMFIEKAALNNDKNMFKFGNVCALVAVVAIMFTACWIATFDPKCATVFGGVGLAAIVGTFIWRGHRSNNKQ